MRCLGSRAVAAWGLVIALCLAAMNWWYTGPAYLIVHVSVVGGAALLSRALRQGRPGT